jgi:hypothetical protein
MSRKCFLESDYFEITLISCNEKHIWSLDRKLKYVQIATRRQKSKVSKASKLLHLTRKLGLYQSNATLRLEWELGKRHFLPFPEVKSSILVFGRETEKEGKRKRKGNDLGEKQEPGGDQERIFGTGKGRRQKPFPVPHSISVSARPYCQPR